MMPPCLIGQWERSGWGGEGGLPVGGVDVGSGSLLLCWFWLEHWR